MVARELAARGAKVHMVCRNQAKGDAAAGELAQATGRDLKTHFVVHQADLARPVEVKRFAKDFAAKYGDRLDALVNNAGSLASDRILTPDGLEATFAVNELGTYILTECLIPTLQKTPGSRVVTVTSAGMLTERLDAADPQGALKWDGTRAYSKHKRAQVELTHHWAVAYPGIQFLSVHPGWADTPGVKSSLPSFYSKNQSSLRTPEQGADSILWCSASQAAGQLANGVFVEDRHIADEHVTWGGTATVPGDLEKLIRYLNELSSKYPVDGVPEPVQVEKPSGAVVNASAGADAGDKQKEDEKVNDEPVKDKADNNDNNDNKEELIEEEEEKKESQ